MRKLKVLLLCVPIHLIGEWYNAKTSFGKFSFKKETKEYWKDVCYYLKKQS